MSHSNELPKVIDKSQADIDAAITAIKSCDLPSGTKDFAISCIRLAVWLPKALLEHKIRLSNLRKLVFGRGQKNKKMKPEKSENSGENPEPELNTGLPAIKPTESVENEAPASSHRTPSSGHGRLPHSAYTNAIEHTLPITDYKAGDLCPEYCGGRLYSYEPGILVRI